MSADKQDRQVSLFGSCFANTQKSGISAGPRSQNRQVSHQRLPHQVEAAVHTFSNEMLRTENLLCLPRDARPTR